MIIYNAKITNDSRFVISWTVINTDEINLPYTNKDNVPPPLFLVLWNTPCYTA